MPEHLGRVVIVRKLSSQGSPVDSGNIVSTRLVLILPSFPKLSETFIVSKFLGLLERGWDVHVVCGMSEEAQYRHFPNLENHPEARRRIKVAAAAQELSVSAYVARLLDRAVPPTRSLKRKADGTISADTLRRFNALRSQQPAVFQSFHVRPIPARGKSSSSGRSSTTTRPRTTRRATSRSCWSEGKPSVSDGSITGASVTTRGFTSP